MLKEKCQVVSLTTTEQNQLFNCLMSYRTVFSKRPGFSNKYQHTVEMTDETPFVRRCYPVSYAWRTQVEDRLNDMLCLEIVKREALEYSSPMTLHERKMALYGFVWKHVP